MNLPRVRRDRLTLVAAFVAIYWGSSIYVMPDQYQSPIYAALHPYFPYLSALFLTGAVLLLVSYRRDIPVWLRQVFLALPAVPFLWLAVYFAEHSPQTGPMNYGSWGLSLLVAAALFRREAGEEARTGGQDLFLWMFAWLIGAVGLSILFEPERFNNQVFDWIYSMHLVAGLAGVAGAAATLCLLRAQQGSFALVCRVVAGLLPLMMLYNFYQAQTWTGFVWGLYLLGLFPGDRLFQVYTESRLIHSATERGNDLLEVFSWVLVILVVVLTALGGPDFVADQLSTNLFVILVCGSNVAVRWLDRVFPAERVAFFYMAVLNAAISYLIVGHSGVVGHMFILALVTIVAAAAWALGPRRAHSVLALTLTVLAVSATDGWLVKGIPVGRAFGVTLVQGLVILLGGLAAIRIFDHERKLVLELQRARSELQRQVKHLRLVDKVGQAIRQTLNLPDLLQTTVTELGQALETDRCHVWTVDDAGNCTSVAEYLADGVLPIGIGNVVPVSTVFLSIHAHGTVKMGDVPTDERLSGPGESLRATLISMGVRSFLATSVRVDGDLVAVLTFNQCRHRREWTAEETGFLDAIAGQVGLALAHSRAHQELTSSYTELQSAHQELTAQGEELAAQQEELAAQNEELFDQSQTLIAQRNDLEEALTQIRHTEEVRTRLVSILESSRDLVATLDLDGRCPYLNRAGLTLLGLDPNARVEGMHATELLPTWIQPFLFDEAVPKALEHGYYATEVALPDPSGRALWIATNFIAHRGADGQVTYLSVIAGDVTDRKQAEQALERMIRHNELILRSAGEGICGVNPAGEITFANPAAGAILGYEEDELIGRPLADLVRPPQGWLESPLERTLAEGATHQVADARFRRHSGELVPVEYVSAPIWEEDKLVGAVIAFKDTTERLAVQRMKNEFISVVSHELRTPLTSIRGSLGLLASGQLGDLSAKGQRLLEIAVQNSDRLIRLINDILDIERIESGKVTLEKRDCCADELVAGAMEMVQAMAEKAGVALYSHVQPVGLVADPDRITQTLTNLLSNAIKFSPSDSAVTVRVERTGQEVLFTVQDQGRGVPGDKQQAIFERFQQVDASDSREKGGTGLGLAICRSIVQQHGGRIWVESIPGAGATFCFTLPLPEEPAKPDPSGEAEAPRIVLVCDDDPVQRAALQRTLEPHGVADGWSTKPLQQPILLQTLEQALFRTAGKPRVLVVEDDHDLAQVLIAMFQRLGVEALHARNGREAVDLSRQKAPDLVVLDLVMPGMDGFGVVDALREQERNVPLVVYTARDLDDDDRRRLRLGQTSFLTKGRIKPEELEARMVELLDHVVGKGTSHVNPAHSDH